jgi:hypothetical protein
VLQPIIPDCLIPGNHVFNRYIIADIVGNPEHQSSGAAAAADQVDYLLPAVFG